MVIRTEAPRTMQTLIFSLGLPTLSEAGLICPMQVLHLINSTHACRRALVLHRRMWTGQQLLNKTALKALRLTHARALGFWGFPKVKKHGSVRLAVLSLVRATEAVGSNDDLLLDNFRLRPGQWDCRSARQTLGPFPVSENSFELVFFFFIC